MRGKAKLVNAGRIEATLELTMTLDEWGRVRQALGKVAGYPESALWESISRLVAGVEQVVVDAEKAAELDG